MEEGIQFLVSFRFMQVSLKIQQQAIKIGDIGFSWQK